MKYAVVIERAANNFAAYVPNLPGCVATGRTLGEAERNIRDAITMHIDGLRDDNVSIPSPQTATMLVEV